MTLNDRKLSFVKEFLNIENESLIRSMEKLLEQNKSNVGKIELKPMTMAELNVDIDNAIDDEKNERLLSINSLTKEIKKWG
jgi:hypothetical protein